MKNIVKSHEEDADTSSSLSRLPDEIVLQILNKLFDLKILCVCYLVSRRFSSIVLQVDTISFTATFSNANIPDKNNVDHVDGRRFPTKLARLLIKPLHLLRGMIVPQSRPLPSVISSFYNESFRSASEFLNKFTWVKSLRMELAFTSLGAIDNRLLFKWKVKLGKGIESFIFLSPNSICDTDGFSLDGNRGGEEDMGLTDDLYKQKTDIAIQCFRGVTMWHKMLMYIDMRSPKLEEVSITDLGRRGTLSLNAEKLSVARKWLRSAPETANSEVSHCYIPVLKLPISGCVMKGVTVIVVEKDDLECGTDVVMNSDESFEDKEEAAYNEAVMEILGKHKGIMQRGL